MTVWKTITFKNYFLLNISNIKVRLGDILNTEGVINLYNFNENKYYQYKLIINNKRNNKKMSWDEILTMGNDSIEGLKNFLLQAEDMFGCDAISVEEFQELVKYLEDEENREKLYEASSRASAVIGLDEVNTLSASTDPKSAWGIYKESLKKKSDFRN